MGERCPTCGQESWREWSVVVGWPDQPRRHYASGLEGAKGQAERRAAEGYPVRIETRLASEGRWEPYCEPPSLADADLDAITQPAVRMALTVAKAQVERGEPLTPNVATVVVMALDGALGALAEVKRLREERDRADHEAGSAALMDAAEKAWHEEAPESCNGGDLHEWLCRLAGVWQAGRDALRERAEKAEAERDEAREALGRVEALHRTEHRQTRAISVDGVRIGGGVSTFCSCGRSELMPGGGYDCPTRAALTATTKEA